MGLFVRKRLTGVHIKKKSNEYNLKSRLQKKTIKIIKIP